MEKCRDEKRALKKHVITFCISLTITILLSLLCLGLQAHAAGPSVTIDLASGQASDGAMGPLEMLFMLVLLALAPSILLMMTSFTRIIIVLSFLRNALGTQQSPPNQVLVGIALFLTLFIMTPVLQEVNQVAIQPYRDGLIESDEALKKAEEPIKRFMIRQTMEKELNLFLAISKTDERVDLSTVSQEDLMDFGLEIIVPAFITTELKKAFTIGFLIFIPFLIIDIVVSSTLMSMGMVMLPPSMIALPFKIMMFVMVDGWGLLFGSLVEGFYLT